MSACVEAAAVYVIMQPELSVERCIVMEVAPMVITVSDQ